MGPEGNSTAPNRSVRVIDDLSAPHPRAANGADWQLFTDQVMGGVSQGTMRRETVGGRLALRMQGTVSLANNGGFVQIAVDLAAHGAPIDASALAGVELEVFGNGERYGAHLRTDAVTRPWQSYRQPFLATPEWRTVRLPFPAFQPHRLDAPLDVRRLRRLGLVAIGRAFAADLAVARVSLYGAA
jgi:hypothetical protein